MRKQIFPTVGALVLSVFIPLLVAIPPISAQPKTSATWGLVIKKKDITSVAKFYPYSVNGLTMEIFAVKATDGTIRTALNTCQVCYDSGRGYYKQIGDVFVCQNCGNRFKLDMIEKIKGGCNPVPVLEGDKTDLGDSIGISKAYLLKMSPYFAYWKKG